jgi:hypothetical protein
MERQGFAYPEKQPDAQGKIETLLKMASAILRSKDRKLAVILEDGLKELYRKIPESSK